MSDEASEPASTGCRYCGSDGTEREADEPQREEHTEVYQVIVLCSACKRPFATIARN